MTERFLIIGLGSIGRRHSTNLRQLRPNSQIAALRSGLQTDPPPAAVNLQFTEWSDALAFKPSAAIICSPASIHIEAAQKLFKAAVPMLIEKPIANSLTGLQSFIHELTATKLPAFVGYNLRLLPSLRQARSLILNGAIGNVLAVRAEVGQYLPDWRTNARYQEGVSARRVLGGGPLLELSHELDYLYWMFGLPSEVTASGARFSDLEIDVEDVVELILTYKSKKMLVNVHLDFLQRFPDRRCRFIGSEGTLIWNGIANDIELYRVSTGQWEHFQFPSSDRSQMYLDELELFLTAVPGAPETLAGVVEGYDVLAIVEAATEAIKQQKAVKVSGYA